MITLNNLESPVMEAMSSSNPMPGTWFLTTKT